MTHEKRLIDANALQLKPDPVDNIMNGVLFIRGRCTGKTVAMVSEALKCMIDNAPTVDAVEVVHARWVHCNGKLNLWYCSNCGEKILYNPTRRTYNIEKRPVHEVNRYCRGCGAKMDGGNGDG